MRRTSLRAAGRISSDMSRENGDEEGNGGDGDRRDEFEVAVLSRDDEEGALVVNGLAR